jgi:hypothetical protein
MNFRAHDAKVRAAGGMVAWHAEKLRLINVCGRIINHTPRSLCSLERFLAVIKWRQRLEAQVDQAGLCR